MAEENWPKLSEEEKKNLLIAEANVVCGSNQHLFKQLIKTGRGIHPHVLLLRCKYVSVVTEPINKKFSELCSLASRAETSTQFFEACEQSVKLWNQMMQDRIEERTRRSGIV